MMGKAATVSGWLLLLVLGAAALTTVGDSASSVMVYFSVWLASTTVPGVLLWRLLARPTTLVQELGFGGVLGIALLLAAWLPATLLGHPALMWLWPIGVLAAFAGVPSLRHHWWPERTPDRQTPNAWHLAMMVVCAVAFLRVYVLHLRVWSLPPNATSTVFQDGWYQLALTQILRSSVGITDPSASGVPLHYHWFSNAHAAATVELSGLPAAQVMFHLWIVAMLLTLLFAVAAAAERLLSGSGTAGAPRWWAGPLAALLAGALPATVFLGTPRLPAIDNGFVFSSASGILALVVVLAFVGPVSDLVHHRGGKGSWLLLCVLVALGAGTKPSLLPVVACGGLLTLVVQWIRTREFPKVPAILTVLPLLALPLAAITVFGSTGGSRLQLFQTLALDPAFTEMTGASVRLPGRGGWLTPGLAGASGRVWLLSLGLLALFVLTELPRLVGLLSPVNASLRRDPAIWWCVGVVGSGFGGLWVLAHPGYSQHYFWRIVIPLGVVLTTVTVVRLVPARPQRALPTLAIVAVTGIAVAAALVTTDPQLHPERPIPIAAYAVGGRLVPYAIAVAVGLAVIVTLCRIPLPRGWARLPAVALVACFVAAIGTATAAYDLDRSVDAARTEPLVIDTSSARYVSAAEQRAALWLHTHSDPGDVIATNVFCLPTRYRPDCRHAAFWLAGLSGRPLFLGGWAYTEKNLTAYGRGGTVPYQRLPSPWPDRLRLSLAAVRAPSPAVVAALRRQGVRWIFADRRATVVSTRLAEFATLEYSNTDVRIFRLAGKQGRP